MYNSVIECCKSIKYIYWVKKRLVWACLKGVTPCKALKEETTNKNYYDDNYSASITRAAPSLKLEKNIFKTYRLTNFYYPVYIYSQTFSLPIHLVQQRHPTRCHDFPWKHLDLRWVATQSESQRVNPPIQHVDLFLYLPMH